MTKKKEATSFESSLKSLESIVGDLEQGELTLEDQMKSFEKGVALSRDCMKRLEDVERKVEMLVKNGNGELETKSFQASE